MIPEEVREMARAICRSIRGCTDCPAPSCRAVKYAERAYNAGYRKPKEGSWVRVYKNSEATVYECNVCKHITLAPSEYCVCGAKMDWRVSNG